MLGISFFESVILAILLIPLMIMMAGIVSLPLYIIYSLIKEIFSKGDTMTKKDLIVRSILFLVVTSFFITFALIGCSNQVTGTYISEKNQKNYIELKADGSFFMRDGNIHGEYEVKGNAITLIWGGRFSTGWIEGNILIASDGNKWVKR